MLNRQVLFVGEGVSLAHIGRPLALAGCLRQCGYEMSFACGRDHTGLVERSGLRMEELPTLRADVFRTRLARGKPVYDSETLTEYVEAELELIERVGPDLVVGDFRVSLSISCRVLGVPYVALANAHWSPWSRQRFPLPELSLLRVLGSGWLPRAIVGLASPLVFRHQAAPFNRVRRRWGLPPVASIREVYTDGDWTLYADLPSVAPTKALPANHHYLGPVLWEPCVPLPEWFDELPGDRPVVYVTMGSSGRVAALEAVLGALGKMPVAVVLATAGRTSTDDLPANVYSARYLPALRVLSRADLATTNGGCASGYQALSRGVPLLSLPSNADQYYTAGGVAASGAGLTVRSGRASERAVRLAVERLLCCSSFRCNAERLMRECPQFDSGRRFREFLGEVLPVAERSRMPALREART